MGLGCSDAESTPEPSPDVSLNTRADMGFALADVSVEDAAESPVDAETVPDADGLDAADPLDAGEPDAMEGPPDMMASLCPPSAPFGTTVGDTFPEIALPDCDGQMHSLHDACTKTATYFFVYAHW